MDLQNRPQNAWSRGATTQAETVDQGLRAHMIGAFNHVATGLAISAFVSYAISHSMTLMQAIFGSPLGLVVQFGPLAMLFYFMFRGRSMSAHATKIFYYTFTALMGAALSIIFLQYNVADVTRAFLITAAIFGGMSLYGYNTKRDLTSLGFFLSAGVMAVFLASLFTMGFGFFGADISATSFALSGLMAVLCVGLIAFETQKLKQVYYVTDGELREKMSITIAMGLYLDFLNIFLFILRLIGDRR